MGAFRLLDFPVEILIKVYKSCDNVPTLLALSSTCKATHNVYQGNTKRAILREVMSREYGPMLPIMQVALQSIRNQALETQKPVSRDGLLKKIYRMESVVQRWVEIYPAEKWHNSPESRRALTDMEVLRLRRAIYRFWLYVEAFQDPEYNSIVLHRPVLEEPDDERLSFLAHWSVGEILDFSDVIDLFYNILNDMFPSNEMLQQMQHRLESAAADSSDDEQLRRRGPFRRAVPLLRATQRVRLNRRVRDIVANESWGDWEDQRHRINDMLKLTPRQILQLKDTTRTKAERKVWLAQNVESNDPDFWGHGATMRDVVDCELADRGFILGGNGIVSSGVIAWGDDGDSESSGTDSESDLDTGIESEYRDDPTKMTGGRPRRITRPRSLYDDSIWSYSD